MSRSHIESIDIKSPATEKTGYSGQYAEFIFDENRNDMTHRIVEDRMVDGTGLEPVTYWV
tara:strand:+ start:85 stop:264 length:180 start_codon:yes stop_codon:yes gene_type:complete